MTNITVSPRNDETKPFKITVVSDADAVFRVERIELTDAAVQALTTSARKLEAASASSQSKSEDRVALPRE